MKTPITPSESLLRVLLIDESLERAALLKHGLQEAGCKITAHVSSSADLPGLVAELKPDLIILDTDSPELETLNDLNTISRDYPRPIVLFTNDNDSEKIGAAIRAGVSAYVVDGMKNKRLRPIMDVAIARFKEFQSIRSNLEKAELQLSERKEIERAKGILMKQRGYSEDEAYSTLRKAAMDKGSRLADVARQLIDISELLG